MFELWASSRSLPVTMTQVWPHEYQIDNRRKVEGQRVTLVCPPERAERRSLWLLFDALLDGVRTSL